MRATSLRVCSYFHASATAPELQSQAVTADKYGRVGSQRAGARVDRRRAGPVGQIIDELINIIALGDNHPTVRINR
jgi:hypothetical protein